MNRKSVIFVHGIGPQKQGYSDNLWNELWQGAVPSRIDKYEVYYYDIFHELNEKLEIDKFTQKYGIKAKLNDIIKSQAVFDAVDDVLRDTVSHVLYYLTASDTNREINNRFLSQLTAAVRAGINEGIPIEMHDIIVISHSLGTVVAYCGLQYAKAEQGIGYHDNARIKALFSLATPLAMIKTMSDKLSFNLQYISKDIDKPKVYDAVMGIDAKYLKKWYSYRHSFDPVASLVPLRGDFLDSADNEPFVFGQFPTLGAHDCSKYIGQARENIKSQILGDS